MSGRRGQLPLPEASAAQALPRGASSLLGDANVHGFPAASVCPHSLTRRSVFSAYSLCTTVREKFTPATASARKSTARTPHCPRFWMMAEQKLE